MATIYLNLLNRLVFVAEEIFSTLQTKLNPLRTKVDLSQLKTQFVPRS